MFKEIFRFELQNKLRRPAVYLYMAATLLFTILTFSKGMLPLGEKQHINSPQMMAFWYAGISMMMMLVSSSVMGMALYRDIEFSTKDYYLTYPITRADYFWGRFTASFLFMLLIGACIPLGIFIGTKTGPLMGASDPSRYGPNLLSYYVQPFLVIVIPNLIFTSCLFYGLVAITRNVKVVYLGGVMLFLAYFISLFYFDHQSNLRVMILSDPFLATGTRMQMADSPSIVQNTTLFSPTGDFLLNRFIWISLGLAVILLTYWRFNFVRFFSGRRDKAAIDETGAQKQRSAKPKVTITFDHPYARRTFVDLTRLELRNIFRDAYFWIIISCGALVLGFAFFQPNGNYWVEDFPRTVELLGVFQGTFLFFVFFILLFYTGEVLHRDRITRYAFINDSLPPANWVINGSRLVTLLILAVILALLPVVVGIFVQTCKGFFQFSLPQYFSAIGLEILPKLLEMVLFCYAIHTVLNNKFAAHGVASVLWIGIYLLVATHTFDYLLWLYPYGPDSPRSDMNGIGHLVAPILWFHSYWLSFGGLLVIVSALFFQRGVSTSLKERFQLIPERLSPVTRAATALFLVLFLALGAWIYYNITYLNDYATKDQQDSRKVQYELALKHYDTLPLPVVTSIRLQADLFPEKQQQLVHAFVSIANLTGRPIQQFLLDGDQLSDYQLSVHGEPIPYTVPLTWDKGFLNFFHPGKDTAAFRLYRLNEPLAPGDFTVIEVHSRVEYHGFQDGFYGVRQLQNGFLFTGGLPELGYDADDELTSPYERKKHHLPVRIDKDDRIPRDDSEGIRVLKAGASGHLMNIDMTISTAGDQVVAGQGDLVAHWKKDGRNYFHYVLDHPGSYPPLIAISARYAVLTDSIDIGHKVYVRIYYHPAHNANVRRFADGYKDALAYYSKVYSPYPFNSISLVEGNSFWSQQGNSATLGMLAEDFGWNAHFMYPDQFDYCYFTASRMAAQQWWRFQVAPNETLGSLDIPEGVATYDALVMAEHKYGRDNMQWILQQHLWPIVFLPRRQEEVDSPAIASNHGFTWSQRVGVELYALRALAGEDSINAALRELQHSFAYKSVGPYAGSADLYTALDRHTPDSLKYFLRDGWLKTRFYENRLDSVTVLQIGKSDQYKVTLHIHVEKLYVDDQSRDIEATDMADYIDIGVFGPKTWSAALFRSQTNPLYLQRYKLTAGDHTITVIVHGKPTSAGIDPYNKLVDRHWWDNTKQF